MNTQKIFLEECNDGLVQVFEQKIDEFDGEIKKLNSKKFKKDKFFFETFILPMIDDYQKQIRKFNWLKRKVITYNKAKFEKQHIDIDSLLKSVDLVDLVGRYVELRKNGKEYKGLCPFHDEKTPSFFVNKEKGVYHCFGCGAKGNAIRFLMEQENLDFEQAIHELKNY